MKQYNAQTDEKLKLAREKELNYLKKEQDKIIPISESFITSRLGIEIRTEEIISILKSLGFSVVQKKKNARCNPR